jgi:hypothetical protein
MAILTGSGEEIKIYSYIAFLSFGRGNGTYKYFFSNHQTGPQKHLTLKVEAAGKQALASPEH